MLNKVIFRKKIKPRLFRVNMSNRREIKVHGNSDLQEEMTTIGNGRNGKYLGIYKKMFSS